MPTSLERLQLCLVALRDLGDALVRLGLLLLRDLVRDGLHVLVVVLLRVGVLLVRVLVGLLLVQVRRHLLRLPVQQPRHLVRLLQLHHQAVLLRLPPLPRALRLQELVQVLDRRTLLVRRLRDRRRRHRKCRHLKCPFRLGHLRLPFPLLCLLLLLLRQQLGRVLLHFQAYQRRVVPLWNFSMRWFCGDWML